eukprot:GDKJ01045278.1.p1 GENE.GDKJ01045278.1~~GDKJ01045278.1.p1  ORF type:complete len:304 (+),score=78.89 GDKJ01045278.1:26-913(+)
MSQPIPFDDYSRDAVEAFSFENFQGFKLETMKFITPEVQISHSLNLGAPGKAGYTYSFGPMYAFNKGASMAMARFNAHDKSSMVRVMHRINNGNCSAQLMTSEHGTMVALEGAKTVDDCNFGGKLSFQGVWIAEGSFSQILTKNLQAGASMTYIANGMNMGFLTGGLRYAVGKNSFSTSIGRQWDMQDGRPVTELKASFMRQESPRCCVMSDLSVVPEKGESSMKLGYQATFNTARVTTLLNTMGEVSTCIQSAQGYQAVASADFFNSKYTFGLSWQLSPQDELSQQMAQQQQMA